MEYDIALKEFDELWNRLPHADSYSRFHDAYYWELRIATVIGGKPNDGNSHVLYRNSDVKFGKVNVEIKSASYHKISKGCYGFRFSRCKHKFADIIVFIGVCVCKKVLHYWISDYKLLSRFIAKDGFIYRPCPINNSRKLNTNHSSLLHLIEEQDIRDFILESKNNK